MQKIKRIGALVLTALFVSCTPAILTGCKTTDTTREARIYYSFRDTWIIGHTAYGAWCERIVDGKISKADERKVDKAWDDFRDAFKLALQLSNHQWGEASPDKVDRLRDDLINLIRRLSE